jgi:hypothetical protein
MNTLCVPANFFYARRQLLVVGISNDRSPSSRGS